MTIKPVIPRARAALDVEAAIDFYLATDAEPPALGLIDALQATYRLIGMHPGVGSPRFGHELDIPGLRSRALARFPYTVFYLEREDHVDVWRVLHRSRDIPELMRGLDKE
ncbi:type II toxin-antitoxin system RelE/ParE family toxin [Nocardia wallacei]|uniref:type II toxin-antitoxin system RelE/ParE family toxin n=1 Tax=Nocardia wallacei TaxID=480035 RepID=UPI0024573746|nr:type II toxin-antitoxin system RelE/ParE family toxin [Nocardia wallacei]